MPDLVIIGAAKAGTTSLHTYLNEHPDIAMAELKELRFFQDPRCEEWSARYSGSFDPNAKLVGESSTMYSRAPALPGVAQRMKELAPGARLIYMVRDPVSRAIASYMEERFHGLEARTFEEAFADLDDPYNPYMSASRYADQLLPFLERYPTEAVHVVPVTELAQHPAATLARIFEFLEVDDVAIDTSVRHNQTSTKIEFSGVGGRLRSSNLGRSVRLMPWGVRRALVAPARWLFSKPAQVPHVTPALRAELVERLAPDADRFRNLVDREFADWSV